MTARHQKLRQLLLLHQLSDLNWKILTLQSEP